MRADLRHLILKRMRNGYNDSDDRNFDRMDSRHGNDMTDMNYDSAYQDGYQDGLQDGRRGVRGSGRRDRNSDQDSGDFDDDFDKRLQLPAKEKIHWLKNLKDKFGDKGPRFSKDEILNVADKMNVDYNDFTQSDLYVTTNMLYSDCTTFRPLIPADKEVWYWVSAAIEWLEDKDAKVRGSEKLLSHYYNIVNG